jgi:hypothetical protein
MAVSFVRLFGFSAVLAVVAGIGLGALAQSPSPATEAPFLAENQAAMKRMAVGESLPPAAVAPTLTGHSMSHDSMPAK